MNRVMVATRYNPSELGSLGMATRMLICQFQFPNIFADDEELLTADHDRCMMWDPNHVSRCFQEHTGTGELGLDSWIRCSRPSEEKILCFLKDLLKAKETVVWTGYRILGTVHRGNGYPVWTLQLFSKKEGSSTKVYSGPDAPNVCSH